MNENSSKSMVVIAGIVALVLGGGIGYAAGMNLDMDESETMNTTSKMQIKEPTAPAADLRVGMNNLLREHVSSSLDVTRSIVDESSQKDVEAATAAQMANAGDIATSIGSVYGKDAQAKITELFVEHIEQSNMYAHAVADGDETAKAKTLKELKEYLQDISAFFSEAINDLPKDTVYSLLEEHEMLLNESVQAYKNGNFAKSYELEREALMQVSGVADALANGVVASNPDKFNQ